MTKKTLSLILLLLLTVAGFSQDQFGRPTTTTFTGNYVDQDGNTANICQSIDEAVPDSVDNVSSPRDPADEVLVCKLSAINDPSSLSNHIVRFRVRKHVDQTVQVNLLVQLRQGYTNEASQGTLITSTTVVDLPTTATDAGMSLASGEAALITDYTDLYLRFVSTAIPDDPSPPPGEGEAWVRTFTALDTVNVTNTAQLATAISTATAGDDIVLADGVYTGDYTASVNGNATNGIRIRATNLWGARLDGSLNITGDYWRVENMHITGRTTTGNVAAVDITSSEGAMVVNCFLPWNTFPAGTAQGVVAFSGSTPNHIVYGNIFFNRRHSIYIQNDFDTNGYKYIVHNVFLDVGDNGTGNRFHFHGYTQSSRVSGMHLEGNIFKLGKNILGIDSGAETDTQVDYEDYLINNSFYRAMFQFGNNRPIDFTATGNRFGKSAFVTERSDLIQVSTNIFGPPDPDNGNFLFKFRTGESTIPAIEPGADWDDNDYYGTWLSNYASDGVFHAGVTAFTSWKTHALNIGGVTWDDLSTHTAGSNPPDAVVQYENDYRSDLIYVAVYNWSDAVSQSITVPFASGTYYEVRNVSGTVTMVEVGTFASSTFNLTTPDEFHAFIIVED